MEKKNNTLITNKLVIVSLFFFSILFLFFNSKNSPLYLFNEWYDPNIYFSVGKGMFNGLIPYRDLFDHKGPLIFFLYGIGYFISNTSFLGVYFIECIALFINLIFAYKIAKIYLSNLTSFITAILYAAFLFTKSYYGGSAEEFISVFITISFYYFILYFKGNNLSNKQCITQMFIHGLMFGFTFLSKLSVCIFWIPILSAIGIYLLYQKEYRKILVYFLFFAFGFIISILPFIIYFISNSALNEAYFGYIKFNSLYAEFNPDLHFIRKTASHFIKLLTNDYISFPILLLGVCLLSFSKKYINNNLYRVGVLLSFILSFVIICLSKYIMTYAHMVIYVYSIFGLIFIFQFIEKYINYKKYELLAYIISFVGILTIGINNKKLFDEDINCLTRKADCNYMQKEFAEIINKEKNPTLLNIGLDLGVYTKTNIIPSYKYFFYPNIPYHIYPEIRDYQMNLIERREPLFIVIGSNAAFYDIYEELPALHENYQLISTYNQNSEDFDKQVFLYKRKD